MSRAFTVHRRPWAALVVACAAGSAGLALAGGPASAAGGPPCGTLGGRYGLIESKARVSCAVAERTALGAYRTRKLRDSYNCRRAHTHRYAGWKVYGPYRNGFTYRWTKGSKRFVTTRESDCL